MNAGPRAVTWWNIRRAAISACGVLRGGLRLVGAGVVIGAVAALALSRTLASLLFGVSATDAWTYGLTALALVVVAVLASYLPARRATQFDPALTLRAD